MVHGAENCGVPQLQFFIVGLEMQRFETVQKTVEVPQLLSPLGGPVLGQGGYMPVVVQFFDKVADVPVVQVVVCRAENCEDSAVAVLRQGG